jgi:hypothetical protein
VRVLYGEEERGLRRPFCDQSQRREADQEEVGSGRLCNPERRLECAPLGVGKKIRRPSRGSSSWWSPKRAAPRTACPSWRPP